MNEDIKSPPFFGGVPTKPEVDRLRNAIGIPEEGVLIPYSQVEGIIREKRGTARFKCVTNAWRRAMLNEHNAFIDALKGEGFVRLNPNDRVKFGSGRIHKHVRGINRASNIVVKTERARLDPENVRVADKITEFASAVRLASVTSAKGVKLPDLEAKGKERG